MNSPVQPKNNEKDLCKEKSCSSQSITTQQVIPKKKKRKASYKQLMGNILKSDLTTEERREQDYKELRKNVGGGRFEKMVKV